MRLFRERMPSVWKAQWIDPETHGDRTGRRYASVLRRRFPAPADGRAVLYVTCHGLYEVRLNGERVGDFILAPGTGDYRRRLPVQAYDVTDLLRPGENEITVTLGDGWYRGCVGIDGIRNYYGEDIALLLQLEVEDEPVLYTDGTWEASQMGPTRENDLQQGEVYDARMEQAGEWHEVGVRDFGYANLAPTGTVPILEQERFPGRIFTAPNGETVIDFGQNLAGYVELCLDARAGQRVILRHGETLDENGNFTQSNFDPGERHKGGGIFQKIEYICRDGRNIYKPRFAIFGFRYAKVETDADLRGAEFTAIAVYSQMPQTGFFTCGNPDVERLFQNCLWSMRSNFCDIPTDCPTRERAGWTGDAGVFAPTAVFLADCGPVLRKWLGECRLAQREDGLVQNIAPVNNAGGVISNMLQGSAGWGDACILVPWALYEAYGDAEILRENYDMMTRWLAFVEKRARKTRPRNRKNPYRRYLVDQGFHFGEWCQPDVSNGEAIKETMLHGAPEVATAYYFRSASLLSQIARILEKPLDAERFASLAENARQAYRFACLKDGRIRSDRQCEYVRPLAFGLLEGDEVQATADDLNDMILKNGGRLNTGFLSTPDLLRVLAEHGHVETAYRLLLGETCPSWLYAVRKGATTVWETWDGIREDGTVHDSLNHYAYGSVAGWLMDGVCGISLKAGHLCVKPVPHRLLGRAAAEWRSPAGTIRSAWEYRDGRLIFDFTLPEPAEIRLPDGRSYTAGAGEVHDEILL